MTLVDRYVRHFYLFIHLYISLYLGLLVCLTEKLNLILLTGRGMPNLRDGTS